MWVLELLEQRRSSGAGSEVPPLAREPIFFVYKKKGGDANWDWEDGPAPDTSLS